MFQSRGHFKVLQQQVKLIDLFCGAGGFTLGFKQHFEDKLSCVWANDFNQSAAETFHVNFESPCIEGDILSLLEDNKLNIPQADIVIGGPPCQGFSLLNKNRKSDERKQLWRPFLKVVENSNARIFVMENVRQLVKSVEYDEIKEAAQELGFNLTSAVLCAADYGVPQTRYRAFIIGIKDIEPSDFFPPKKTHFDPRSAKSVNLFDYVETPEPYTTVRDAIADLSEPQGTEILSIEPPLDIHFGRNPTELSQKRYRAIPDEGMNRFDLQERVPELTPACWIRKKTGGTDLFGRMWWDRPSFTIRTEFFKPEKGRYLHPVQHRPITHREAARLQSFPDEFIFHGSKIEIARQIGNAVPPLLAKHVAACVEKMLIGTATKAAV